MLFFYYGSGDLGNQAVRLSKFRLEEAAEGGTFAMSSIEVDDPSGALDLVGLHNFHVAETACSWQRLFTGYFADRTLKRADSLLLGASRRWDCSVTDANTALTFEIIRGDSANRPAETDIARLTWWLGSGFTGPIGSATTFIDSTGPVNLDASDYRGRTGYDLLNDCGTASGKNYFVAWNENTNALDVHYYAPSFAINTSSLSISNVLADVDQNTVYCPDIDAQLEEDPSSRWSGVYLAYGTGDSAVYETDAGVLAAIGHKREASEIDPTITTATKATAKAQKYLAQSGTEFKRITVTLRKVPQSQVNLIRAGQRIQVKLTHFPGFTSFTYIRVARRVVEQEPDDQLHYRVTLTLADTKLRPGRGLHDPSGGSDEPEPPETDVCQRAAATIGAKNNAKDALGVFSFGVGGSVIESAVTQNTAYTIAGCAIGCGMYGPGTTDEEAWWPLTESELTSADVGLLVTVGVAGSRTGQATSGAIIVGIGEGTPTAVGQYTAVGAVPATSGGTVLIPRSLIGTDTYLVLASGWHAGSAFYRCAEKLIDPCGGPVSGGEGGSGQCAVPSVSAGWMQLCKSGWTNWVAGIGAVNGTNRTFTLINWDGHGVPKARVDAVIGSPNDDYTYDSSAKTVTINEAPAAGSKVAFRYYAMQSA